MALNDFRRFPLKKIRRWNVPICGDLLVKAFERLDRNGALSDFCADPQQLYERWWPHRLLRRKLFPTRAPLISVVVATRNNEATIERSLRSLIDQTLRNLEILVIDDASTDNSMMIIRKMALSDRRIRVIANKRQIGTGASRNRGLQAAAGEYVTFQDGDDFSAPSRLEMQYEAFKKSSETKIVLCNYVRVSECGLRLEINDRRVMKCIISMMFPRKEVIEKVGYFVEGNLSEDADFYERIKIAFGERCEVVVFRTLYEALFRENSSFFSAVDIHEFSSSAVKFTKRPEATAFWQSMQLRHAKMRRGEMEVYVSPAQS
ncbi:glycosyltransferase [Sinorhizobium medicae]|uniref:glycosyltransferase family 2 protein n=1 Tax=Sinorhizobium medicae TaxID=110321 RepID=UPI000FD8B9C1|nr:glycosyltransferase family A protein [Sinorhizobium medicae]MDX0605611.1 glycosyltransferase [Sinorhizobium medicae]MDX0821843.1 glycosyltransferase [Sinorhizobium medicae]MDX0864891.1 glycosyltransferase [Sinorhizobium medicae]RVJ17832.1 glycosyltransferase family 2 protein [Sinorhizobium medicae]